MVTPPQNRYCRTGEGSEKDDNHDQGDRKKSQMNSD